MSRIIRVGSLSNNDIVINSQFVSRSHADILCNDDGSYTISDHSSNGTIVNGIALNHNSMTVRFGDVVVFAGKIPLDWNKVVTLCSSGMQNGNNINNQQRVSPNSSSSSNNNTLLCVISFLIPLVGLIIYFSRKNTEPATSSACGKWALIGFAANLLIGFCMSM